MILAHDEIIEEQKSGKIIIDPFILENVGANSVDVRLGNKFKKVICNANHRGVHFIDPKKEQRYYDFEIIDNFLLDPTEIVLAETIEIAGSDHYVPMIEGRSTLARMGLNIHACAGFGDIGFVGKWTLELTCTTPIILYPGMRIAQVYFVQASSNKFLYDGHYKDQDGVKEAFSGNI